MILGRIAISNYTGLVYMNMKQDQESFNRNVVTGEAMLKT